MTLLTGFAVPPMNIAELCSVETVHQVISAELRPLRCQASAEMVDSVFLDLHAAPTLAHAGSFALLILAVGLVVVRIRHVGAHRGVNDCGR